MVEMKVKERLFSLDLLRGLDMFLLTVIGPFVLALGKTVALPGSVEGQFRHGWECFTLWDIIMPLFIFMSGAAVPFALRRRLENGRSGWVYWRHVLIRFAFLWFLGLVAQGRLMTLDPLKISPFNNTLQSIAVGYLLSAVVFRIPSRRVQVAIPIGLAIAYAALLHCLGDYTMTGNFAQRVENAVVPLLTPVGSKALELADPGYTWWLTSMMFGTMSLCGMESTLILTADTDRKLRFWRLFALGVVLEIVGWTLVPWIPIIKPIYTLTFTAQAMGWCCLALALLFLMTDVFRFRRGLGLFTLFGQTALLAYMCIEVFGETFGMFASTVTQGFGPVAAPLVQWFAVSALLVVVLYCWRRGKVK